MMYEYVRVMGVGGRCVCVAGPLIAVINAQAASALTTVKFINEVGFDADRNSISVSFNYNTTNATSGDIQENSMSVPILTILPIPFIRVSKRGREG